MYEVFTSSELFEFLKSKKPKRPIRLIQNHHTYKPDYAAWIKHPDHAFWIKSMHEHHVKFNGWAEIGQHFTTFPDGKIGVCRDLDKVPACIPNMNKFAICIEHLGNFDSDLMTSGQRQTIIEINAILSGLFCVPISTSGIIYHRWYSVKTCPGKNFFGGNTKPDAEKLFYPEIKKIKLADFYKKRMAKDDLNVRSGPGTAYMKIGLVKKGENVVVYENSRGWVAINQAKTQWVSGAFLGPEF